MAVELLESLGRLLASSSVNALAGISRARTRLADQSGVEIAAALCSALARNAAASQRHAGNPPRASDSGRARAAAAFV